MSKIKFILRAVIFFLPIILLIIAIELYITYGESSFANKANHLKDNLGNIEILILGSSRTQNSINPELLSMKSANLAYANQDYMINAAIFSHYVDKLEKLRYVILELDYLSLLHGTKSDYFRIPWYYRYHSININDISNIEKISLLFSSPDYFKKIINRQIYDIDNKVEVNKYGFFNNNYSGPFHKIRYDSTLVKPSKYLTNFHNNYENDNYIDNVNYLKSIINHCQKISLPIIFIKNPVYKTFYNGYDPILMKKILETEDSLINNLTNVHVFNFENYFPNKIHYYIDEQHLNSQGALLLTSQFEEELNILQLQ
ncbi:MAG: hypothetical protein HOB99_00140 [Candidatus Marinimicrobia bacterium]|nr:hypothetical protein [Candidatus Neomarinimicrobiota bacterium]MBT4634986.1 hypothetical protein [Candidatus Neomarinimicrobiota bacterium]MBT4735481.1 hypothetical protein [Candidatus Neomarinimicrobiota bacterium]MBT7901515.1 hypothetical protein [Candidatus Neomarinimicrobiota bacterium]